ncbi:hypothetical protein EV560_10253 [Bosea sp. BK604]|nr:hypothetical protein EV560_10253 [Bosea sp. BK604]
MPERPPPPRKAAKGAVVIVAVVGAMIVAIFIGFNLHHAGTTRELRSGHVDPKDAPKTPTDLQAPQKPERRAN